MNKNIDDLPPEIGAKLMTFLRETNSGFEVADMAGLLNFVAEYGERHPVIQDLVKINRLGTFQKNGRSATRNKVDQDDDWRSG